ncbi:hypothetical protein K0M31_000236 [Melipona bicolor]|uniref:Uncharacterized protein n=1 Tax=Melipona bicolor TaxID=60889 RepID=A0AA40KWG2_9HYME|nr:hypothetical protein K0M31_000236 [Melipona bicolor]
MYLHFNLKPSNYHLPLVLVAKLDDKRASGLQLQFAVVQTKHTCAVKAIAKRKTTLETLLLADYATSLKITLPSCCLKR